ncbi:MAG TPA: COX15/CtaA family protein [Trebonia sp.]|jgi:cytochrome c oxidase assembly protein subunit 15|nr:COX15/CtaA family protein [Trebonia sp.]
MKLLLRAWDSFWRPTLASVRGWALAAVVSNAVIITTGAAVRLSSSGLGCDDWPKCSTTSLIAAHVSGQSTLNTWIEFGNRLLNYPLVVIAGLTFIACWRYRPAAFRRSPGQGSDGRRQDLVRLSLVLPLGVVAQAVVGGIVVLTHLNPAMVALHYLLSSSILAVAVVLHTRTGEGQGPARPRVRADLRVLALLLAGAVAVMLAAGTVVTGTGPLAGTTIDSHGHHTTVPRFHLSLTGVTQLHADIAWFISATAIALVIGLRFSAAPARTRRYGWLMVGGVALQAVIGYTQYFLHLPAGLVWVHVGGSVLLWVLVLKLYLSTRERLDVPAGAVVPDESLAALEPGEIASPAGIRDSGASTAV